MIQNSPCTILLTSFPFYTTDSRSFEIWNFIILPPTKHSVSTILELDDNAQPPIETENGVAVAEMDK